MHQYMLGLTGWKAAQGKDFGSLVNNKFSESKEVHPYNKAANSFLGSIRKSIAIDQERWSFLCSALVRPQLCSAPGSLMPETYRSTGTSPAQVHKDNWWAGASFIRGEAGTAGMGQAVEEYGQGDFINVHKHLDEREWRGS